MMEGLRVKEVTGESLGSTLLWLSRNIIGKAGLLLAHWQAREEGALEREQGVSPGCKSPEDP